MAGISIERDHVVARPWWYAIVILLQMAITAAILVLLFPYTGPENGLPGLHRFFVFVAMSTFTMGIYYLISYYLFAPAYNCWAWLICCCWLILIWMASWVDITLAMGRMATGDDEDPGWGRQQLPRAISATVISTINAILVIASLIVYSRALHRHRRAGAPYTFHGRWRPTDQQPNGHVPGNHTAEKANRNPNRVRHLALSVQNYELAA